MFNYAVLTCMSANTLICSHDFQGRSRGRCPVHAKRGSSLQSKMASLKLLLPNVIKLFLYRGYIVLMFGKRS